MPEPVTTIRNLGPAMERSFAAAGIRDAGTLRALGADAAYARLPAAGERPHFIVYYAIVMGLQGRLWTDCTPAEKLELRRRFDALKAGTPPEAVSTGASGTGAFVTGAFGTGADDHPGANDLGRLRLEAALSEIGVIERRRAQPTSSRPEKK